MPHILINPQHPNPRKTGRVIRCGSQTRLDTGPHAIPRSYQLSSQSCNDGSFEAQLSDHPADHPHTQTRPGSTHRVVLLNESHDPAGAFAAYPASLKPPQPCRDPGPGCVDHLHHHTPVTLTIQPTTRAPRNPRPTPTHPHSTRKSPLTASRRVVRSCIGVAPNLYCRQYEDKYFQKSVACCHHSSSSMHADRM